MVLRGANPPALIVLPGAAKSYGDPMPRPSPCQPRAVVTVGDTVDIPAVGLSILRGSCAGFRCTLSSCSFNSSLLYKVF